MPCVKLPLVWYLGQPVEPVNVLGHHGIDRLSRHQFRDGLQHGHSGHGKGLGLESRRGVGSSAKQGLVGKGGPEGLVDHPRWRWQVELLHRHRPSTPR